MNCTKRKNEKRDALISVRFSQEELNSIDKRAKEIYSARATFIRLAALLLAERELFCRGKTSFPSNRGGSKTGCE